MNWPALLTYATCPDAVGIGESGTGLLIDEDEVPRAPDAVVEGASPHAAIMEAEARTTNDLPLIDDDSNDPGC